MSDKMIEGVVGRCASRRSAALRAEPVALSQAKPAAAIAGEWTPKRIASLEGARFSPNLRAFMKRERYPFYRAFSEGDGRIVIGWPDDYFVNGASLMEVLCEGGKANTWAFPNKGLVEIEGFWDRYAKLGRCAIDPEHNRWWKDERWHEDGDRRECLWCGHRQERVRWTETVERERWEASGIEAREGGDAKQAPREARKPARTPKNNHQAD